MQRIRVHLDVPDSYRALAQFGIRMLLLPWRVQLIWKGVDHAEGAETDQESWPEDVRTDLYYGIDAQMAEKARFGVVVDPGTPEWFARASAGFPAYRYVIVGHVRIPVCFDAEGPWSFDPVASVAYLLSGWQEVVLKRRDEHGRFPFDASFQAATETRTIPVADWIRHIVSDTFSKKNIRLERKTFGDKSWAFCATHDIDYIRKWHPGIWKRELLHRALMNDQDESPRQRMTRARRAVWSFFESGDPFRAALTRIPAELEGRRARGTFFYKAAAHGFRDVDYALTEAFVHDAIERQRRSGHEVGLHPSYHSHAHPERLAVERSRLESAAGEGVGAYRAHYLRFDYPSSIHHLDSAGFKVDSTLGWATCAGFRFGTCLPFPLFDPVSGMESGVWEIPLITMESALFNRAKLSVEEAVADTIELMEVCRSFGGVFTGLWHNTLWDEADYPGWGAHFEATLAHAANEEGYMGTLSDALDAWR